MQQDPQWVLKLGRYTKELTKVRRAYDATISTLWGVQPAFGPVIHHTVIATAVWLGFTYLPMLDVCATVVAYCIPFVLYIPLQRFTDDTGREQHHSHEDKHKEGEKHHHDHTKKYHGYMHTHPTAAALGAAIGAAGIAFFYSPVAQNSALFLSFNQYTQVFLQEVFGVESSSSLAFATALFSIATTAVTGAALIYVAQGITASVYDYVVRWNAPEVGKKGADDGACPEAVKAGGGANVGY